MDPLDPIRNDSLILSKLAYLSLLILTLAPVGCRSGRFEKVGDGSSPRYEQVNLVYELNGRFRDIPIRQISTEAFEYTSETPAATESEHWMGARLAIQYPHPDGTPGLARATLRLSGQPAPARLDAKVYQPYEPFPVSQDPGDLIALRPLRDDEVWVLDFPKQQLDLLLTDLQQCGFFDNQLRNDPGTRLEVELNRGKTAKNWSPEPRLDDFVSRVQTEGRLSGFVSHESAAAPHPGYSVAKR